MANDRSAYMAISMIPGNTDMVLVAQLPTQLAKKLCLISRYFMPDACEEISERARLFSIPCFSHTKSLVLLFSSLQLPVTARVFVHFRKWPGFGASWVLRSLRASKQQGRTHPPIHGIGIWKEFETSRLTRGVLDKACLKAFFFLSSRNRYQGLTGPDPAKPAETRDPPTKYWLPRFQIDGFIVGTGESRARARGALPAGYGWVCTPQSHLDSS
ncbi:hypothetical protein B9Z19DRAFT_1061233 [Tuber borchii]|uniref:Uncharacterized protein n=1 Tax=Tuber borchii TaxID=42251 RepID=A0A2T7A5R3_TUBBO|nr:hypothetical protein B9Z19DRAFT_1061233 [Tuber borchii]